MSEIGNATFGLVVGLGGFRRQLAQGERDADRGTASIGQRIERGMRRAGDTLTRTLTPAAAAFAAFSAVAFSEYDRGIDTVRAKTGATGDELDDLSDTIKDLGSHSTQGLGDIGAMLAEVESRTGQAGPELERLTEAFLELEQIGMGASVAGVTRLFGDWSVATDHQVDAMDRLFRVAQETGVPIERTTELLVQYGAPLRQLGFDLQEGAALMAKWEQEGVNVELVAGAMRVAIGRLAHDGPEYAEALTSAQESVAAATERLAEVQQRHATETQERVQAATERLSEAQQRNAQDTEEKVSAAYEGLADAQARSQDKIARATEKVIDLQRRQRDEAPRNALDLKQAQLDVEQATNSAREAVSEHGQGSIEARQAQLSLERAQMSLAAASRDELAPAIAEAQAELAKAKQTTPEVTDAQVALADALTGQVSPAVTQATADLVEAQAQAALVPPAVQEATSALLAARAELAALMTPPPSDRPAAFQEIVDGIKNAGSTAEANALAVEAFGARAGPDMAAAIREGRFEIDDLMASVDANTDTIHGAAGSTEDWTDKLAMLKNRAMGVLGPVGEIGMAVGGIASGAGPAIAAMGGIGGAASTMGRAFLTAGPYILAIGAALLIGKLIYDHWDEIAAFFGRWWQMFQEGWDRILGWLGDAWGWVADTAMGAFKWVNDQWQHYVIDPIITGVNFLRSIGSTMWDWISAGLRGAANFVLGGIEWIVNTIIDALNVGVDAANFLNPFGDSFSRIGHITLPRLEHGGTATRGGLSLVGEAGPEVLALPGGASVIPIDRSVGDHARGRGGEERIVFELDGRVLVEYVRDREGKLRRRGAAA